LSNTTLHVRTLSVSSDGIVLAGTDTGLLRSTDEGESWDEVGPPGVNDLEELSSGALVAVGREGVHRSSDQGLTWEEVLPKPELDECGDILQYTYIVSASWGEVFVGSLEEDVPSGGCKNISYLYRSMDGVTWSSIYSPVLDSQAALPVSTSRMIVGGDGRGGIALYFNATNGGPRSDSFVGELGGAVTTLVRDPQGRIFAASGQPIQTDQELHLVGTGTGIHRSTDLGETWQQVNVGLSDTTVADLVVYPNGTLLAATLYGGVNRSTDGGDSWQLLNTGLPSLTVTALAYTAAGHVFAGTDQGIYRTTQPLATATEDSVPLPTDFWLGQNYPNPFTVRTTIPFEVPERVHISLVVYDVLGREVARLADRLMQAGIHEAEFSASHLPSGSYFYRLQAGAFIQSGRMTLLK
jgi:hypothetical protein